MKQLCLRASILFFLGLYVPFVHAGCGSSTLRNTAIRNVPDYTECERTSNVMRLVLVKSLAEAEGSAKLLSPRNTGLHCAQNRSLSQSPLWLFIMACSVCMPLFGAGISDWRYSEERYVTGASPRAIKRHASCVVHPVHREPYQFQYFTMSIRGKRGGR